MQKKQLRIIIFDHQHFNCLYIERMLNCLGYYRVAPVSIYEEFVRIIENAVLPIGLVIYNVQDCERHNHCGSFVRNSFHVENFMPYNEAGEFFVVGKNQRSSEAGYSLLPDFFTLRDKIEAIESLSLKK
ncbi:hypothetical protein HBR93_21510 [Pseudomonas sp. WS 5411]|uniref:hypothetical protein n=1 Tax=Pseudomonas sp. WS 5411 TaxID=2717486 RepID=UPI0014766C4C|nr:hypothetical protein [Pseudomonas sp. WS 5411]NMY86686.1 hypothetical protein [Pseudomonas sp. WS 5411]